MTFEDGRVETGHQGAPQRPGLFCPDCPPESLPPTVLVEVKSSLTEQTWGGGREGCIKPAVNYWSAVALLVALALAGIMRELRYWQEKL